MMFSFLTRYGLFWLAMFHGVLGQHDGGGSQGDMRHLSFGSFGSSGGSSGMSGGGDSGGSSSSATVDTSSGAAAVAQRGTVGYSVNYDSGEYGQGVIGDGSDSVIYGTLEDGFTSQQGLCGEDGTFTYNDDDDVRAGGCKGGISVMACTLNILAQCPETVDWDMLLDDAGAHDKSTYHLHANDRYADQSGYLDMAPTGHSDPSGTMTDGEPIYGWWEGVDENGIPFLPDLDYCGGHWGTTPDSSEAIFHYHYMPYEPSTLGCHSNPDGLTETNTYDLCKSVNGCDGSSTTSYYCGPECDDHCNRANDHECNDVDLVRYWDGGYAGTSVSVKEVTVLEECPCFDKPDWVGIVDPDNMPNTAPPSGYTGIDQAQQVLKHVKYTYVAAGIYGKITMLDASSGAIEFSTKTLDDWDDANAAETPDYPDGHPPNWGQIVVRTSEGAVKGYITEGDGLICAPGYSDSGDYCSTFYCTSEDDCQNEGTCNTGDGTCECSGACDGGDDCSGSACALTETCTASGDTAICTAITYSDSTTSDSTTSDEEDSEGDEEDTEDSGLSGGVIALIIVGSLLGVGLIITIAVLTSRGGKGKKSKNATATDERSQDLEIEFSGQSAVDSHSPIIGKSSR